MTCRFYGKNGMHGALVDTSGNQCGLHLTSHAPCAMEMAGQAPDDRICPFITSILRQVILMRQVDFELPGTRQLTEG